MSSLSSSEANEMASTLNDGAGKHLQAGAQNQCQLVLIPSPGETVVLLPESNESMDTYPGMTSPRDGSKETFQGENCVYGNREKGSDDGIGIKETASGLSGSFHGRHKNQALFESDSSLNNRDDQRSLERNERGQKQPTRGKEGRKSNETTRIQDLKTEPFEKHGVPCKQHRAKGNADGEFVGFNHSRKPKYSSSRGSHGSRAATSKLHVQSKWEPELMTVPDGRIKTLLVFEDRKKTRLAVPASHVPSSHVPSSHVPASHVPASHVPASHVPSRVFLKGTLKYRHVVSNGPMQTVLIGCTRKPRVQGSLPHARDPQASVNKQGLYLSTPNHCSHAKIPESGTPMTHLRRVENVAMYAPRLMSKMEKIPNQVSRENTIHKRQIACDTVQSPGHQRRYGTVAMPALPASGDATGQSNKAMSNEVENPKKMSIEIGARRRQRTSDMIQSPGHQRRNGIVAMPALFASNDATSQSQIGMSTTQVSREIGARRRLGKCDMVEDAAMLEQRRRARVFKKKFGIHEVRELSRSSKQVEF